MTKIKISPTLELTLADLSVAQIIRVMGQAPPEDYKPPVPPEGFTAEQAEAHIESFRTEMESYRTGLGTIEMFRMVGMARALAVDQKMISEDEQKELNRLYSRYAFQNIDTLDEIYAIGSAIYSIVSEMGDLRAIFEAHLFLRERAGMISPERVQEILKSLYPDRQRQADSVGSGENQPQEQSERIPDHSLVPAV